MPRMTAIAATQTPTRAYAMIHAVLTGEISDKRRSEDRLAARLVDRDPDALGEVYDRFGRIIFGFLVNTLRDRSAAEDVQQQVFLEVWQRAPTYDSARARLLTWIMTIARSRAIDQLRRRSPVPVGTIDLDNARAESVDAVDALIERWGVAGMLDRLHPEQALVLRMRFYEELSQTEIAERIQMPLGTVKMRMVTGLNALRELIEAER